MSITLTTESQHFNDAVQWASRAFLPSEAKPGQHAIMLTIDPTQGHVAISLHRPSASATAPIAATITASGDTPQEPLSLALDATELVSAARILTSRPDLTITATQTGVTLSTDRTTIPVNIIATPYGHTPRPTTNTPLGQVNLDDWTNAITQASKGISQFKAGYRTVVSIMLDPATATITVFGVAEQVFHKHTLPYTPDPDAGNEPTFWHVDPIWASQQQTNTGKAAQLLVTDEQQIGYVVDDGHYFTHVQAQHKPKADRIARILEEASKDPERAVTWQVNVTAFKTAIGHASTRPGVTGGTRNRESTVLTFTITPDAVTITASGSTVQERYVPADHDGTTTIPATHPSMANDGASVTVRTLADTMTALLNGMGSRYATITLNATGSAVLATPASDRTYTPIEGRASMCAIVKK